MNEITLPWDLAAGHPRQFDALALKLAGQRISAVYYQPVSGGKWPDGHRHDTVHEIDMAIRLSLVNGHEVLVRWEMQGLNEGLGFGLFTDSRAELLNAVEFINISATPEWRSCSEASITQVAGAFHVPNEGCPEALWAIRLNFANDASVVIALGEMSSDRLAYLPDGIVAIFDEAEARGFQIQSSAQSAWGESQTSASS